MNGRVSQLGALALFGALVCALASLGCAQLHLPTVDPALAAAAPPTLVPAAGAGPMGFCDGLHQSCLTCLASLGTHLGGPAPCGPIPCGPATLPAAPVPVAPAALPGVAIAPSTIIAPVGSEVVLVASVNEVGGVPAATAPVEWVIAPNSVGYFVARRDDRHWHAEHFFPSSLPRKITNEYAVGNTLNRLVTLTRGTPTPVDDVALNRGQAWMVVTSPMEGTSYVSAYAPDVPGWDRQRATSIIHWVDAQWTPPPAAVNPVGSRHALVTTVTRQTDGTPIAGWRVRYEIASGPPASFAPSGTTAVEVVTNELGQAAAEMFQAQPAPGVNQINVQLIRPEVPARGDSRPLVIGNATTQKTWTSPEISLRTTGPAQASVGATVTYQVQVANPGTLPARGSVVSVPVPEGLTFLNSNPPATVVGNELQWTLGDLAPGQTQAIEINYRADRAGVANHCANLRTAEGLTAQDCVTTTITGAQLDVQIGGPERVQVGQEASFEIAVTNRGAAPISNLLITDTYDPGLQHEIAGPIEKDLGTLAPGETKRVGIRFQAAREGRQCHTVTVTGPNGVRAVGQACVDVVVAAQRPPGALAVTKTGPSIRNVGEFAEFVTDVKNVGEVPLEAVKVSDEYERALLPVEATTGFATTGELIWEIATLLPGETRRFRVRCRAQAPTPRSCNRVIVTTLDGRMVASEACLEIRGPAGEAAAPGEAETGPAIAPPAQPAPPEEELVIDPLRAQVAPPEPATGGAPLAQPPPAGVEPPPVSAPPADGAPMAGAAPGARAAPPAAERPAPAKPESRLVVHLAEQTDPLRVGNETTYYITVHNPATYPQRQVQLGITLPAPLLLVSGRGPTRSKAENGKVVFEPIAELRSGETVTYSVRVRALETGAARLQATVSGPSLGQPVVREESTLIINGA